MVFRLRCIAVRKLASFSPLIRSLEMSHPKSMSKEHVLASNFINEREFEKTPRTKILHRVRGWNGESMKITLSINIFRCFPRCNSTFAFSRQRKFWRRGEDEAHVQIVSTLC